MSRGALPGALAGMVGGLAFGAAMLQLVVLIAINAPRLERFTGLIAGVMVATFILAEAPAVGDEHQPGAHVCLRCPVPGLDGVVGHFTAPPSGMLLAAEAYVRVSGRRVRTAKLCHDDSKRCIFRCDDCAGVPPAVEGGRYAARAAL